MRWAALAVLLLALMAGVALATVWPTAPERPAPSGSASAPGASGSPNGIASPNGTPSPGASTGAAIGLPNPIRTPGSTNPDVTPETIRSTICRSGWTATVRPPAAYTNALKLTQIVEYGYADRSPRDYEEDHLIPLSLGGAPREARNLWPEPRHATLPDGTQVGADVKDRLEIYIQHAVCDGRMSLADAQRAFADDWIAAWEAAGRP